MVSTSAEAPGLAEAGAEDAAPPARAPAKPPSWPAVPTSGRGQERGLRAQRRPGGFRACRTPPRIHCLREDFLDYSPPPLLVDLDPA